MSHRLISSSLRTAALTATAATVLAACVEPMAEPEAEPVGVAAPALGGVLASAPRNVVAIEVGGQRRVGVLIDGRRALFDASLIPTATAASALTVSFRSGTTTQTRTGLHLDRHPFSARLGLVQVYPAFTNVPALVLADPAVTPATNAAVCQGPVNSTQMVEATGAWAYLSGHAPPILVGANGNQAFAEADLGVPCFRSDGRLLGLMSGLAADGSGPGGASQIDAPWITFDASPGAPPPPPPPPARSANAWVAPAWDARAWISNLGELARVRELRAAGSLWVEGPISFVTTPAPGAELCMDVPWGSDAPQTAINQYPCHGGRSQQFYLEWDVNFWAFRVYAGASGLCLDVEGASTVSGAKLQQYTCHSGQNQRWRIVGNQHLAADHAPGLCASARTGASATTPGLAITDRTCVTTGDVHQRWSRRAVAP